MTFQPGDFSYDQTSGDWIADKTFSINTVGGIYDGDDVQFSVQLSNPNMCQLAGTGGSGAGSSAKVTIVRPSVIMITDAIPSPGQTLDGKHSTTIVVGQQVKLQLSASQAIAGLQWQFNGEAVGGYSQTQALAEVTDVDE